MSYRVYHLLTLLCIFGTTIVYQSKIFTNETHPFPTTLSNGSNPIQSSLMMRDTVLCEGDCLSIDNQTICEAGTITYTDTEGNAVTLNVSFLQPISIEEKMELCVGDCFKSYCEAGTFSETIKSTGGCDSVYKTYQISYLPGIALTILPRVFLCPGECYDKPSIGGTTSVCNTATTPGGILQDTPILEAANGCDSLVFVEIFFEKDQMQAIDAVICNGEAYPIGGELLREEGIYPITLTSSNGCDSTVVVNLTSGDNFVRDTTIRLCEGSVFILDGVAHSSGTAIRSYRSKSGCDSVVNYTFVVSDSIVIDTVVSKCIGDTLKIGSIAFTESANQMFQIPSTEALCDSFISVNVTFLDCRIESQIISDSIRCSDDLTGRFSFTLIKGFGPFTYQWTYLDSIITGPSIDLGETITAEGLPQGSYTITVTDVLKKETHFNINITGPDYWSHEWLATDYNGYTVRCNGGKDGELTLLPIGGVPPYSYQWSSGETGNTITDLATGTYIVTIKDIQNCSYIVDYEVTEPPLLEIEIDSIKPNCDSFATGVIKIVSEQGGFPPYEHFLSGIGFSERNRFEGLIPGNYELIVSDENGCSRIFETFLPAPDIPELSFDRQLFTNLADPIELGIMSNVPLATIEWSEELGLNCYNCLNPIATPNNSTTYTLTAISNDGCETTEQITVNIAKERDVFVPNIFSPNGDGLNDRLTVFGGPEVIQIQSMRIFSRWGELVYERTDFSPNDELIGWDGRFDGRKMPAGTYIWIAQVNFVDGITLDYSGDVIVR